MRLVVGWVFIMGLYLRIGKTIVRVIDMIPFERGSCAVLTRITLTHLAAFHFFYLQNPFLVMFSLLSGLWAEAVNRSYSNFFNELSLSVFLLIGVEYLLIMPLAGLGGASKTQLPLYTLFLLEILPKLAATLIFSGDLHEYFYASSLALVSFVEELYAPMSRISLLVSRKGSFYFRYSPPVSAICWNWVPGTLSYDVAPKELLNFVWKGSLIGEARLFLVLRG
jgi:hypothetical protein